ncbi:MAG: BrnA antitoxin family protein [Janthinobacterium lividum]
MNSTSNSSLVTNSAADLSAPSRTDWERVDALSDKDIDTSDIPPLTEEDFARSSWRFPAISHTENRLPTQAVTVEVAVDEEILAWFQSQGQDYPQRMRAALRLYAEAHQAAS